jgi:hypothetical protein
MTPPPERTLRHFPGQDPDLADPAARAAVVARLLEDGDRDDLGWLARRVDRHELAAWVARHGARRLSRRSRAFWFRALDLGAPTRSAEAEALWPLA